MGASMTLGEQLKKLRAEKSLSQPELAELAGIEQSYLSKLENDKSLPSNEVFRKLLSAFALTVAQFIEPLEASYIKANLLVISDIEQLYKQATSKQLNKQRNMLYLASTLIVLSVTLFYLGYAKQVFNETQYEYRSSGIVLAGEPINIFSRWGDLIDSTDPRAHGMQMRKTKVAMAQRSDLDVLLSDENRGGFFDVKVEGGRRLYERMDHIINKQPRAINAWLQVLGVLLFASGIMGFVLERRLFNLSR